MRNSLRCFGAALVLILGWLPNSWSTELADATVPTILQELKDSTTPEAFQQVSSAIQASPAMQQQLAALLAVHRFAGFVIAPRAQIHDGRVGLFGGFTRGPKIVITTEFLAELARSRLFDVVYPDDIAPDNTVFALAHLLHHVATPVNPTTYPSPLAFMEAAIKDESVAFLEAWNAMLAAAEQKNEGKPLSARQVGQLLMNTRYRFAFLGALKQQPNPLHFSPTGMLELNATNVNAISATLKNASRADLE